MATDKPQSTYDEIVTSAGSALDGFTPFFNKVLIGVYMQPEVTKGGILLTQKTRDEDKYQGKVGFVLKAGPDAFRDSESVVFNGQTLRPGQLVFYRISDGFPFDLNGVHCRLLDDIEIRGTVLDPTTIY